MSHVTLSKSCSGCWLADLLSNSRLIYRNGKNESDAKKGGRQKGPLEWEQEQSALWVENPQYWQTPSARSRDKPPTQSELEKRTEEAEKWGGHQSHQPDSWPRWLWRLGHLCQVGRSQPGGNSDLTVGGKAPQKEFLQARKVKKPQRYWPGTVALHMRSINFRKAQTS